MPFIILTVLVQVAFVMHILKTGRNTTWIWIVLILPMAGAIAYFFMEVLPDLKNSSQGRQASRKINTVLNPNKDIKNASRNLEIADTIENSKVLAEECFNKGMYTEAKELYEKCLQGFYADDPDLMFGLVRCEFNLENYSQVKSKLDVLKSKNPDYRNPNAHLLYARALEALQEHAAAEHEYETLHSYFSGPEASFHYAKFLKATQKDVLARDILQEILKQADLAGRPYANMHKDILKQVKLELRK